MVCTVFPRGLFPEINNPTIWKIRMVTTQGRNETLTSLGGKLRRQGMEEPDIYQELSRENSGFSPRLPDSEIQKVAKSVCRYPAGNTTLLPKVNPSPNGWKPVLPVPDGVKAPETDADVLYQYRDAAGQLLGYVQRWNAMGKQDKRIRPLTYCENSAGSHEWRAMGFDRPKPLYCADLVSKKLEARVVLVEGEKCADMINRQELFDLVAVSCFGGSPSVKYCDFSSLKNRAVIVWPDNDEPGRKAACEAANALRGVAKKTAVLKIPNDKPQGWDAADLLAEGGGSWALEQFLVDCETTDEKQEDTSAKVYIPTWDNAPSRAEALMELDNVRILSRGNISMLTAGAGLGKSSILEAACASVLAPMGPDSLGLSISGKAVLFIDTERSAAQHNDSWRRMMKRAGYTHGTPCPPCVRWECISEMERLEDRLNYLWSRIDIDNAAEVVLLDGIGDFVADPNDSDECTALIYRLSAVVKRRDIGLFTTLHVNPSTNPEKARGVLGSELWRKVESSLIVKRTDDEVRCLTNQYSLGKNRSGSDQLAHYFAWGTEEKMFVTTEAPASVERKSGTGAQWDAIVQVLGEREKWGYKDAVTAAMAATGRGERTAKSRVDELVKLGRVQKNGDGTYSVPQKKNRQEKREEWYQK